MKNYLVLFLTLVLIACGPSQEEIKRAEMEQQRIEQEVAEQLVAESARVAAENSTRVAAVTCAVMGATRNMDAAIRVEKMNEAREKIGGEPFLRGDAVIKEAFEYGLCEELVLNVTYDATLGYLKDVERERKRITVEKRAEEYRIATEQRAERERIAVEKRAEVERISAEKQRIAAEKQRIADSKPTVEEEFHPNGELKEITNYQSKDDGGKKHGLNRTWWDNGQLMSEKTYKNGKEHGLIRLWDENGQLKLETCTSNGEYVGMSNCQG